MSREALFPQSERVLYERNPLNEVILQVQFPTILRIDGEAPIDFQERVRARFPIFEKMESEFHGKVPDEVLQVVGSFATPKGYNFIDENARHKITLSSTTASISNNDYVRWEEFSEIIDLLLVTLTDVYSPSYFTRVGLRYQNVLQKSVIGIDGSWAELLIPEIAGELCIDGFSDRVENVRKAIQCKLDDEGDTVLIQHGFVTMDESPEDCYLLDFDYSFEGKTEISDVRSTIERLHGHSGNAFRWAITPALHDALGPTGQ